MAQGAAVVVTEAGDYGDAGDYDENGDPVPPLLEFLTVAQLRDRVAAQGPRTWLLRGIWPAGDYGIHGAEPKAQKTWNTSDLAVAVASGTPWLGSVPVDTSGPVLMFVGEGGQGNTLRRLDAAAQERGLNLDDLPIVVCTRAPYLNDVAHMHLFGTQVAEQRPVLVTLDPLYLAARGAELGDLYKMGALLERPQRICQHAGASLWVVHHHNRQAGTGSRRLSGAGPAEWGRVLITGTVKTRHRDPDTGGTRVLTELEVIGGEVAERTLRVYRHVWSDDPDNLDSPLHTQTTAHEADETAPNPEGVPPEADLSPAARKLLEALDALGAPSTSTQLVDWIAQPEHHGHGLRRETASRELNKLEENGVIEHYELDQDGGRWPVKLWSRTTPCDPRDVTRDGHTGDDRVTPRDRPLNGHGTTSHGHGHTAQPHTQGHAAQEAIPHPETSPSGIDTPTAEHIKHTCTRCGNAISSHRATFGKTTCRACDPAA